MNQRSLLALALMGLVLTLAGIILWTSPSQDDGLVGSPVSQAVEEESLSPEVAKYKRETDAITRKSNEIAQYLNSVQNQLEIEQGESAEDGQSEGPSSGEITELIKNCTELQRNCDGATQAELIVQLRSVSTQALAPEQKAQLLKSLTELAALSAPLAMAAMDFAVEQKELKALDRFFEMDGLHAEAKAYLIEASVYQNDDRLRRQGLGLLQNMLKQGSVAEALAATAELRHFPDINEQTFSVLQKSLCRFRNSDELGFELMKTRINRVKSSNTADLELNCRG